MDKKGSLYPISIPLYVDFISKIDSLDQYKEALSHLENKKYGHVLALYKDIKKLEESHNKWVSKFMEQTESRIMKNIDENEEIHLKDVKFLRAILKDEHSIEEAITKGQLGSLDIQAGQTGALTDDIGIHYDNLFEHFMKQALDYKKEVLQIGTQPGNKGWYHPILFRSDSRDKIIAKGFPGSKSISNLKDFIDKIPTMSEFGEINSNLKRMNELYAKFNKQIKEMVHDYDALKLKGKCRIEYEINFSDRIFHKICQKLSFWKCRQNKAK